MIHDVRVDTQAYTDNEVAVLEDTIDDGFQHAKNERVEIRAENDRQHALLRDALDRATSRHVAVQSAQRDETARLKGRLEEKADSAQATLGALRGRLGSSETNLSVAQRHLEDVERDADAIAVRIGKVADDLKAAFAAARARREKEREEDRSWLGDELRDLWTASWSTAQTRLYAGIGGLVILVVAASSVVVFFRRKAK